jgi:hypothetical protein
VIDWKEAARHYRWVLRLAERQEIDLKRTLWVERDRRVRLQRALDALAFSLLVAREEHGAPCIPCGTVTRRHRDGCAYVAALEAVHRSSETGDRRQETGAGP